uniref:Uncharacterized protein n=1 Tax=Coccidioides posadasii RMSCC 3488 TaxID=454284 RepID=A0A0J6FRI3_COCPO|nr:hypothetical protein CPAG_08354 [Coccidioides posadasii RMSCC 3488]
MEVTKSSFGQALPRILNDIAESCCVALDLEFSGIFSKQDRKPSTDGSSGGGRTLQSRYEEVKEAAEKYQILQVGLTFIREDVDRGTYTLRPYNFNLNPIIDPKLDLERTWTCQSSDRHQAIDLLLRSGFRMDAPFIDGVPYISREEEGMAKARVRDRQSRLAAMDNINFDSLDTESMAFLEEARRLINDWVSKPNRKEEYVNIPSAEKRSANQPGINNYQKRLIHQLVRSEYPDLVSIGRAMFVQIVKYDKKRELNVQEGRMRQVRERIYNQTGFRWIVEAMTGGDLSRLSSDSVADSSRDPHGRKQKAFGHIDYLQAKLKSKRLVLVGHNIFTDLVNFYKCFIGGLPDKVEEFLGNVHELFPMIVDTKYLATHDCGSALPSSALEELDESLRFRELPTFTDAQHTKYVDEKPVHEAGYDSLMTARVFLRLASQLHAKGVVTEGASEQASCDGEGGGVSLGTGDILAKGLDIPSSRSVEETLVIRERECSQTPVTVTRQQPVIAHATKFDILADQPDDISEYLGSDDDSVEEDSFLTSGGDLTIDSKIKHGKLLPRLDNEFWKVYGNKLRMFGIAERFCELRLHDK